VRRTLAAPFGGAVGKDTVSWVWRKVKSDWDAWARCAKARPNCVAGARPNDFVDCNARLRQPGIRQTFGDALKITGILVRQDARALH
jgi:hypothetical protein